MPIWAFVLALTLTFAGCQSRHKKLCDELWSASRQALQDVDTAASSPMFHMVDSLQSKGEEVADTTAMSVALNIAQCLFNAQDYGRTINYVFTSHHLLEQMVVHDYDMQSNLIGLDAFAYESFHAMRFNDRAVQGYLGDLPLAKRLGLKESLAFLYNNLGSIYIDMNNYDEAIAMLHESIRWNQELADSGFLAFNYNNLSSAYMLSGNSEKAIEYGFMSLYFVSPTDTLTGMRIRRNIAGRYTNGGEYSSAQKLLLPAMHYFREHSAWGELALTYKDLANAQWKMGDIASARESYNHAFSHIEGCNPADRMKIAQEFAQFCDSVGDRDKLCDALKYAQQLSDTLEVSGNQGMNDAISQLYQEEVEKGDANNKLYRRSRARLLCCIAILAIALIAAWATQVVTRRRNRVRMEQQERMAEGLRQELMAAAVDNERTEALVAKLNNELQSLQRTMRAGSPNDAMSHLRHITAQVMQVEKSDSKAMTSANAEFFRRLMERFPNLTQNDLRLCALLRQGMSSKEMAEVMGREVRSIETARNRLRKKCGLQPGEDIFRLLLDI